MQCRRRRTRLICIKLHQLHFRIEMCVWNECVRFSPVCRISMGMQGIWLWMTMHEHIKCSRIVCLAYSCWFEHVATRCLFSRPQICWRRVFIVCASSVCPNIDRHQLTLFQRQQSTIFDIRREQLHTVVMYIRTRDTFDCRFHRCSVFIQLFSVAHRRLHSACVHLLIVTYCDVFILFIFTQLPTIVEWHTRMINSKKKQNNNKNKKPYAPAHTADNDFCAFVMCHQSSHPSLIIVIITVIIERTSSCEVEAF